MNQYMLLLACSNRKIQVDKPTQAIDVYDGVLYRVLKKAFIARPEIREVIDLYILSAKYGIIHSSTMIEPYEFKMTQKLSEKMKVSNTELLKKYIKETRPWNLTTVMGKCYFDSIDFDEICMSTYTGISHIFGSIGYLQKNFKEWLMDEVDPGKCL